MASKTIKGITVEIDGNSMGLSKALSSAEKSMNSAQSELREIDKLLKLDPTNTELLGQKQKVLAQQVNATGEKLEKLKRVQEQVDKQYSDGEIDDGQYRAFCREIEKTEIALRKMEDAADDAGKTVKASMQGAEEEVADVGEAAEKSSKGLGETLGTIGKGAAGAIGTVVGGITTVGAAAVTATVASRGYREEMNKLTVSFTSNGHGAETAKASYSELIGIIGETDQTVEAAQQIALLADNEKDVVEWSGLAAGVVATFGDALKPETFYEAANETLKLGGATGAYAQMLEGCGYDVDSFNSGLEACKTAEEKQQYMLRVTNELLGEASAQFKEVNADIISQRQATDRWNASMAQIGTTIEPVIADVTSLGADGLAAFADSLALALSGDVEGAAEAMSSGVTGLVDGITETADTLVSMSQPIIQGFLQGISESVPMLAPAAVNIVVQICETLISALPLVLQTAITLVGELASALSNAFATLIPDVVDVLLQLVADLLSNADIIIEAAVALVLGLVNGISAALPILVGYIPTILIALTDALVAAIPILLDGTGQMVQSLLNGVLATIPVLVAAAPQIITGLTSGILGALPMILDCAVELVLGLATGLVGAIPVLVGYIPDMVVSIVDALIGAIPLLLDCAVQLVIGLAMGIVDAVPTLVALSPTIVMALVDALLRASPQLWACAIELIGALAKGLLSAIPKLLAAIPQIISGLLSGLASGISQCVNMGKNLVQGLWEGLTGSVNWLKEKITGWVGNILDFIRESFGVHSPASTTEYFGKMLSEGLAVGIEEDMTPEEVLKKKCENLKSILDGFVGGLKDRQDLHDTWLELWNLENPDASPVEKLGMSLDMIDAKLREQDDVVEATKMAWEKAIEEFGSGSEQAREYESAYAQSMIDRRKLQNERKAIVDEALEREKYGGMTKSEYETAHKDDYTDTEIYALRYDRNEWLKENASSLLESGMTYDEVVQQANKVTGYDKAELQIASKTEVKITNGTAYDKFKVKETDNQTEAVYI